MTLLVSILVPVYNAAPTLARCLESIVNQTYRNLQIILLNDGSTDESSNICQAYASQDARIEYYYQVNRGVAAARNRLLNLSRGNYILYIDADDWIEATMVERMLHYLDKHAAVCDIVMCASDSAEYPRDFQTHSPMVTRFSGFELLKAFLQHSKITGMLWNKLIPRRLITGINFNEAIQYGEDALFLWPVLCRSKGLLATNEILYHYMLVNTSISHKPFSPVKYGAVHVWQQIEQDVRTNYPTLLPIARSTLCFQASYTLYDMYKSNYSDSINEKLFKDIVKERFWEALFASNISVKAKLFSASLVISSQIARTFCKFFS